MRQRHDRDQSENQDINPKKSSGWDSRISPKLLKSVAEDMSKTFDSLSHSLTIKKLEAYGFRRRSLGLMRSFFENRHNRVKSGEITSDWIKMKRGCPQGSSFGPLLVLTLEQVSK
ncbi:hypothetical protein ACROYT_G025705 [Oculina patagonica]